IDANSAAAESAFARDVSRGNGPPWLEFPKLSLGRGLAEPHRSANRGYTRNSLARLVILRCQLLKPWALVDWVQSGISVWGDRVLPEPLPLALIGERSKNAGDQPQRLLLVIESFVGTARVLLRGIARHLTSDLRVDSRYVVAQSSDLCRLVALRRHSAKGL